MKTSAIALFLAISMTIPPGCEPKDDGVELAGCLSKAAMGRLNLVPFGVADATNLHDKDIFDLIELDTAFVVKAWKVQITTQYDSAMMNAIASWDPTMKAGTVTLGIPFIRTLYKTGEGFASNPGQKKRAAQAGVRAVLYHEFAHVLQFSVLQDQRYRDGKNSKWLELEADAMGAAFLKAVMGWEESAVISAIDTYFSLGSNDYNAPDPHGFPYEREKYARLGMSYVKPIQVDPIPFKKIHEELFAKDVLPYVAAASSEGRVGLATAEVDRLIIAWSKGNGPEFTQDAGSGFSVLIGTETTLASGSLHGIALNRKFNWEDPIGVSFSKIYAANAKFHLAGDQPDAERRKAVTLDLRAAKEALSQIR